jgi:hypothetical protein
MERATGEDGAVVGDARKVTVPGTVGSAGSGVPGGGDGPATARSAAELAERVGFGAPRGTHALGGGDPGCLMVGLAVVLLPPGIGLTAGSYRAGVTALGAVFLAMAVALVVLTPIVLKSRDGRIPRLHLYDGGLVLSRPEGIAACPWSEVRVVEYTKSTAVGQGGNVITVNRLRLEHIDGEALCSLGPAAPIAEISRLALAGGART